MTVVSPGRNFDTSTRADAVALEEALGPAHAHVGLERQPAEPGEQPGPAPAAQLVPDEVDRQRHRRDRADHQRDADPSLRAEGADHEEGRHGRKGIPTCSATTRTGRMTTLYVSSHRSTGQVHVTLVPSAEQRDDGGNEWLSARGAGGGAYALRNARRSALITS